MGWVIQYSLIQKSLCILYVKDATIRYNSYPQGI